MMQGVLLSVGSSNLLYEVQGPQQSLLGTGPFVLSTHVASHEEDGGAEERIQAKVGEVSWDLNKSMPCLRTDDFTYTFAISMDPSKPVSFYCVIFERDLSETDIGLLQTALVSSTAYSGGPAGQSSLNEAPAATNPTWDDGQEAMDRPGGYADEEASTGRTGSALRENIMKGGVMFGASLRRAVAVAGTTLNNAKAKAEASIAPETKAKIGAAVVKLNDFSKATGQSASAAYTEAKAKVAKMVERTTSARDFARSESLRDAGKLSKEKLNEVYLDMKKVGERVVAAIRETAAKVRARAVSGTGEPPEGPSVATEGGEAISPGGAVAASFPISAMPAEPSGEDGRLADPEEKHKVVSPIMGGL